LKKNSVVITAVLYGLAAGALVHAQTPVAAGHAPAPPAGAATVPTPAVVPTRIAVINLQDAMMRTREGQQAQAVINKKFGPKKTEFDNRQKEIETLTDRLNKGRATMSDEAQRTLTADIQKKSTDLKRYGEDSQSELDNDEAKIAQELQTKMGPILTNYAIQNNFAVVLDVGQQSPVLWYASATNITEVMVALYDQVHPVKDEAPAVPQTAAPALPKPPVVKK
jgi:outer membrane protein